MNFKYYDVISSLVVGYVLMLVGMYSFQIEYNQDYTIAYLAVAFLCGYFINTIGSLLEPLYYFTIGGKPSNRLLNDGEKKHSKYYHFFIPRNTGLNKVRFYETKKIREILMKGFENEVPSEDRLFSKALRTVCSHENSRIPDFNAHYALARTILTTVLISAIMIIISSPCSGQSYLTIPAVLVCWNRYKERAYYYAREVLNEYLKMNKI